MKPAVLKKIIFSLVAFWIIVGAALVILLVSDVITKALFEKLFVIGFAVFAIVAGLLSKSLGEIEKGRPEE